VAPTAHGLPLDLLPGSIRYHSLITHWHSAAPREARCQVPCLVVRHICQAANGESVPGYAPVGENDGAHPVLRLLREPRVLRARPDDVKETCLG
jgi:hypothetical protein